MSVFDRPRTALGIALILVLAIVLLIAIVRLTSNRASDSYVGEPGDAHCVVARRAIEAFDQGKAPPTEWIQDRAAAAEAVRTCDRR